MMRRRPAPSAERTASSRVLARGARQQQVRDVRAADQQHEADDAEKQHRRHLEIAADRPCRASTRAARPGRRWSRGTHGRVRRPPPTDRTARLPGRSPGFIRPTTCSMYCAPGARRHVDERPHGPEAGPAKDLEAPGDDADDGPQHPVQLDVAARRSAGSRLKRDSQSASLITTTRRRCASSSARNVRPAIGLTPSTSKMPAVTHWRETVSALPSRPAITMPPTFGVKPAIFSNVRLRAFQSSMFGGDAKLRAVAVRRLPDRDQPVRVGDTAAAAAASRRPARRWRCWRRSRAPAWSPRSP